MVAIGREHIELIFVNAHDRHVESAAAQVKDENGLFLLKLVEPISQRRRGWLVDELQHIEPGELSGRNRGSALGIIEISGHRDDRVRHRLAKIFFGVTF